MCIYKYICICEYVYMMYIYTHKYSPDIAVRESNDIWWWSYLKHFKSWQRINSTDKGECWPGCPITETWTFLTFGADTNEYKMYVLVYWLVYFRVENNLKTCNDFVLESISDGIRSCFNVINLILTKVIYQ